MKHNKVSGILKVLSLCLCISFSLSLKVLVAGDFDDVRRPYLLKVADLYGDPNVTNHIFYVLSLDLKPLNTEKPIQEYNFYKLGLPNHSSLSVEEDFAWNSDHYEEANFLRLEFNQIRLLFDNPDYLEELRKMNFDIGIGGLSFSDALLFRELNLPYIRISQDDIESYTMQFKLNMPVLTSTYPSVQVYSDFNLKKVYGENKLPDPESLSYRWDFFQNYQWNRWKQYKRMSAIKEILDQKYHKHIDDWDQEHCMILGEGIPQMTFQSVMPKPPNIKTAYPLIYRLGKIAYYLPPHFYEQQRIDIWNIEASNPSDIMYDDDTAFQEVFATLLKQHDMKYVVLHNVIFWPKRWTENYPEHFEKIKQHAAKNPRSICLIDDFTFHDVVIANLTFNTQLHIIQTCSLQNQLYLYMHYGNAYTSGYFNPKMPSQKYECQKLYLEETGKALNDFTSREVSEIQGSINQLYRVNNQEASRIIYIMLMMEEGYKTLNYWIEYVHKFGIEEKIPKYDKMSFIVYNNLDLLAIFLTILYILYRLLKFLVLDLCCSCLKPKDRSRDPKKTKRVDRKQKEN